MSDLNLTLYKLGNTDYTYEIQFCAVFEESRYQSADWELLSVPSISGETLAINLYISPGEDSYIIHNVAVGGFPNDVSNWILDVQYIDEQGIVKKKVKTEQAQAESEPRPIESIRS
jgi:hypothetical protein